MMVEQMAWSRTFQFGLLLLLLLLLQLIQRMTTKTLAMLLMLLLLLQVRQKAALEDLATRRARAYWWLNRYCFAVRRCE